MPVPLSMRGFAEVVSAAPNRKQVVLRRFRAPKSGESVGRSNFYVKADSIIKHHHKGETAKVAAGLSALLAAAAKETNSRAKTKLLSNYRAASDYLQHFGSRKLKIMPGKRLHYRFNDLLISAHPDIVAEENGTLVLIKLNLGKKEFSGGVCATLLHVLYEAAILKGLNLPPTSVECLQSTNGIRLVGPKTGFPGRESLDAECLAVLALCTE